MDIKVWIRMPFVCEGHGSQPGTDFPPCEISRCFAPVFSGLKISASYAVVGAVVSEWLGGFNGLGVYMTRVKKAYSFDKMFAVIYLHCDHQPFTSSGSKYCQPDHNAMAAGRKGEKS